MASGKPFTLLTAGTPNGWKPSITLEELNLPYEVKSVSLSKNEQKEEWFTKINPNGRIPALIDHQEGDLSMFESGAIMWYLATKYDPEHKLWPKDLKGQVETMSWLMFQMGGIGPMQGQANHFVRYAPEKIEYGINRYTNETKRLYKVVDKHLEGKEWLAGGQYTIADIANFSWIFAGPYAGVEHEGLPNLQAWLKRIESRPAVQKGLNVPDENKIMKAIHDPELMKQMVEEAQGMMVSTKKE